jgi:hypothetical protein
MNVRHPRSQLVNAPIGGEFTTIWFDAFSIKSSIYAEQTASWICKQFFVDQLTQNVPGHDVSLLDSWDVIAGDTNAMVNQTPQLPSALAS